MSFPYHDRNWNAVADFINPQLATTDRVLAPDPFWWRLPSPIERWVSTNLSDDKTYDWVIAHKGELDQFPRRFLEHIATTMRPVFANAVFVIWTSRSAGNTVDPTSSDLIAFFEVVSNLPATPSAANRYEQDRILESEPRLERFADMSDDELRATQNEFFRGGGYRYVTPRDVGYLEDIHAHLVAAMTRWSGGTILDLACGAFAFEPVPPSTTILRVDFAEEGVRLAARADGDHPSIHHATMDAHHIGFADGCFDAVAFVDSIEHVRDSELVLREVARVLRPGGELLVTYANRNSVNQVITRRLGYPEFMTNHQHIREFTPAEIADLLDDIGLDVLETAGVGLLPFWGIPGIDEVVRTLTDDDPEVVEMMRRVGRQAGVDHAYTGVALARKRER